MTLDGKKTYITAAGAALASFAAAMGWLSKEQYEVILGLLGSLGLAALRSGVGKYTAEQGKQGGQNEGLALSGGAKPAARYNVGANG